MKKEEYELFIFCGIVYSIVGRYDWGFYVVRLGGLGVFIIDSYFIK